MISATRWLERLEPAPERGPQRSSPLGDVVRWRLPAARDRDPALVDAAAALLTPVIMDTLPGYGDGRVAARCLCEADLGYVWLAGDRLVGMLALRDLRIDGVAVLYGLLAAIDPALQSLGLLRDVYLADALPRAKPDVLAVTTHSPVAYRSQVAFARRFGRPDARVLPDAATDGRVSEAARDFGRRVLGAALDRDPSTIPLDERLVRRGYRERDLQAEPMPRALEAACRGRTAEVAAFFRDDLALEVGDTVLVLVDVTGALARIAGAAPDDAAVSLRRRS